MKPFFTRLLLLLFISTPALIFGQAETSDFYKTDDIQQIRITFEQDNWRYYLDSLRINGDQFLLGNVSINGTPLAEVGVRYAETRSFNTGRKRNSLNIQLDYIDRKQNYEGFKRVDLSNALRDPSMVREVLGYEIARQYMPAPQANYARVYVNNQLYGLMVNVEAIDEHFLDRNFGSSEGTFLKATPNIGNSAPEGCKDVVFSSLQYDNAAKCYLKHFRLLSENGWDELIALTKELHNNPQQINQMLNIDRSLWMLAFNNVMVNLNSYTGQFSPNYYLYRDAGGQFTPIISDLNFAFGSAKNTGVGSDLGIRELIQLDPMLHEDNAGRPLISALLSNPTYKKMYQSHLQQLLFEQLSDDKLEKRVIALQALIRNDYLNDPNKQYPIADFENSRDKIVGKRSRIPGLVDFMDKRAGFLKRSKAVSILPPGFKEVKVLPREKFSPDRVTTFKIQVATERRPETVKVYYRFDASQGFREAKLFDDGKHHDLEAADGVFGIEISPDAGQSSIEYFLVAENVKSIGYSPARYMFERHTADLASLNR